jgi:hypothetical protein
MEATLLQLNHVVALGTLLPPTTPSHVHEELNMGVTRTKTLMISTLAKEACSMPAEYTGTNVSLDIFWTDKFRALCVRAVRRVRRRELFHFEIKVLNELLR